MGQVGCIQCVEGYYVSPRMVSTHKFGHQSLRIYPNPASDVLYIEAPETTQWTITNLQGTTLTTGVGNLVNVSGLSTGTYILNVLGKQKRVFVKL